MSEGDLERDALLGHRLVDRYVIEKLVARGGMARVYRAQDDRLDRPVAVKVLSDPFADDPAYVRRFLDEARIAASITHPNLAHVYDSGEDDGVQFMVLELLDGYRSLRDEVADRGRLRPGEAIDVAAAVLGGLAPLHAHGLVHCDVKAGNILRGPGGTKLIDFGIARPLRPASLGPTSIGSLHSMSPEQLRGDPLTPASDIFAVGVVLFQALTGRVPFPGETPAAVAAAHDKGLTAGPADLDPDVPEMLDAVVRQALQLEPSRRFTSAEAMSAALEAARGAVTAADRAPTPDPDDDTTAFVPIARSGRSLRRPRMAPSPAQGSGGRLAVVVAFLAVVVAAGVVAIFAFNGIGPAQQPADAASRTPTQRPTPSAETGKVVVPDTIGMSEADAEAAAREAGLTWRLEWQVDPSKPAGVYDQEPAAGQQVDDGARFVMYAYRTR